MVVRMVIVTIPDKIISITGNKKIEAHLQNCEKRLLASCLSVRPRRKSRPLLEGFS